jgi:TPR repeat protein
MSRGAVTEGEGGVEETKADAETLMVSASTGRGKEFFNLYGCDLSAPRARIRNLCAEFPEIGKAINKWRKARMEDPELQAGYKNLEEFVDFSLSQFLHLTSEFTVSGSDKKIFYRNANFEYDRELRDGFESVIEAIRKEIPEDGSNPALQAVVGWWYLYGDHDDQKKAVEFFKVAAEKQSNNPATVRESFEKSFAIADVQNGEAQVAAKADVERKRQYDEAQAEYVIIYDGLATCYQQGIGGCGKDVKRAIRFYQLAADQGYVTAQSNLAYLRLNGIGGEKDAGKAKSLYQLAADQGDAVAQRNLAYLCLNGIGGEKDAVKARSLYQLTADQGDAVAQRNLAYLCLNGIGGEKNRSLAILYYSRAIAQGDSKAISSMEPTLSKPKIDKSSPSLTKDQIIEIINNLAPQKQTEGEDKIHPELERGVRIFNKNSHLIGDLVEVSKDGLEAADLFEIYKCLSDRLATAGIDPMKSKSCQKIRECIAEKIKSEIGESLVGEIKFSDFHGTTLSFSVTSKEAKAMKEAGARTLLLSDAGGAGGAESVVTLDGRLGDMHRGGELAYDRERGIITVTKTHLEKFSTRSVPTADVGGAGASAVVGGAAVARGGGGRD